MEAPAIRVYGDRALLLECDSIEAVLALAAAVREAGLVDVVDVVPGARTVLVSVTGPPALRSVHARLADITVPPPLPPPDPGHADAVIEVAYDGADLDEVAAMLQMDADAVVEAHTATPWRVGFVGFAPGFAYLVGGDARLTVPRRSEPRTRVPAGSVALAGGFSGVYPRESPGGWQLIGRTTAVLWDADRPRPALLTPGMTVLFRAAADRT